MYQGWEGLPKELTDKEKTAVKLAEQFRQFIQQIKKTKLSDNFETLFNHYKPLHNDALDLLMVIAKQCQSEQIEKITNLYYLHFLRQISRYNQFFNTVKINALDIPDISVYPGAPEFQLLQEMLQAHGIGVINHVLLKQPAGLLMTVNIHKEDIFSDINENDGNYYYSMPPDKHLFNKNKSKLEWETGTSTVKNFFTPPKIGEAQESWFKPADKDRHDRELAHRRMAIKHIREGKFLTPAEQKRLCEGQYYSYHSPIHFGLPAKNIDMHYQITHLGHGSEFITLNNSNMPLFVCVNPVHDDPGSWSHIRNMDPAFDVADYPVMNVVLLTDYNSKHCSISTLKSLFDKSNVLFIVPQGCGALLRSSGLLNIAIVELATFNAVVDITVETSLGTYAQYQIRSFPANHVCNRPNKEAFKTMSMGYLMRNMTSQDLLLYASNSALLSSYHYQQLYTFCFKNHLQIKAACIPMGPDRPRLLLEDQHQSTLDVLNMHAMLTKCNAGELGKFEKLSDYQFPCYLWGNSQGCFNHGLTSFRDVDATITRVLLLLRMFTNMPVAHITESGLNEYLLYHFMDDFEQKGFFSLLKSYRLLDESATAEAVYQYITTYLSLPMPGAQTDFNPLTPFQGFQCDYERLLLNRRPDTEDYAHENIGACEYFLFHLDPQLYMPIVKWRELVHDLLTLYIKRPRNNFLVEEKASKMQAFLQMDIPEDNLESALGFLYNSLFDKADNSRRNEGHAQTMFILLAGLRYFPEFRQKMAGRHQELHSMMHPLEPVNSVDLLLV